MVFYQGGITMNWWKQAVIYQIYPKSFQDSNHDGWGDIQGIITRLPYLHTLGVTMLWITPMYVSPQHDHGYDIADYLAIDSRYGTMEDFEALIEKAHALKIKIMMDIVVNHTSTDHRWFQHAKQHRNSPYRDYYIIRKSEDGTPPNNWESMFQGSAWEPFDHNEWYLHLFDVTQADLNWECDALRQDLYQMMNTWMKKGVDGLRLDVINLISKDPTYPNDTVALSNKGKQYYANGPKMHTYLKEMHQEVFGNYNCVTVGEMMSMTPQLACSYTHPDHQEVDMIFSFQHLKVDYEQGDRWTRKSADIQEMKQILSRWQVELEEGNGWNSLVWSNHDQPRVLSRFGDEGRYHKQSAKMLATALHMLKGTPYIYQGEEIGMLNAGFTTIEEYQDVESINVYKERVAKGIHPKQVMEGIMFQSRDNARTPIQWDHTSNGGFSDTKPWMPMGKRKDITVADALQDPDSIFYHYQHLINIRKEEEFLALATYQLLDDVHPYLWTYTRTYQDEAWLVINNFSDQDIVYECTLEGTFKTKEIIISNYPDSSINWKQMQLRPYESVVYRLYNELN